MKKSLVNFVLTVEKSHKYVKREGTPGHYKYYYRLPDGSIGTKKDLEAAKKTNPKTSSAIRGEQRKEIESLLNTSVINPKMSKEIKQKLLDMGFSNDAVGSAMGYAYHSSGNRRNMAPVLSRAIKFLEEDSKPEQKKETKIDEIYQSVTDNKAKNLEMYRTDDVAHGTGKDKTSGARALTEMTLKLSFGINDEEAGKIVKEADASRVPITGEWLRGKLAEIGEFESYKDHGGTYYKKKI